MDVVCYECSSTSRKFIGDKEGIALICIFILNTKQSAKTPKKTVRLSSQVSVNKVTLKTHFS